LGLGVNRKTSTAHLAGYAWGENIGWINLDDLAVFVAVACSVGDNDDGILHFFDLSAFLTAYSDGCPQPRPIP
jgi:hypothetical protein